MAISDAIDNRQHSIEQIENFLCGLEEGFGDVFDPADAFPEHVTVRLCRSVSRILNRPERETETVNSADAE